jgi:hypothetical protein
MHGLKYVVGPEAYGRMVAGSLTPETASDGEVALYADKYFEYDSSRRVTLERVRGGVSSYQQSYSDSAFTPDGNYNVWVRKTVETLPDNSQKIAYSNFAGQVMLKVIKSGSQEWYEYYQYDGWGRVILKAESSAVQSYSEGSPGLVTLKSGAGLIHVYEYAGNGFPQGHRIRQGSSGSLIKLREWAYTSRAVGGTTIYPLWKETVYQSAAGGGSEAATTEYGYAWFAGSFQVEQRTTTLPVIPGGQNGSGTANSRVEVFDGYGRNTWRKDERGFLRRFKYDDASGGLLQQIEDVQVSQINDAPAVPSGWTTPSGGGLHLITDNEVDVYGRLTQELGPAHPVHLGGGIRCGALRLRCNGWNCRCSPLFPGSSGRWSRMGSQ